MKKQKETHKIPVGAGYGLGLVFGIAIMITFAVGMRATFFAITLGLSIGLSLSIAFECAFAEEKKLPLFQRIMLSLSAVLLILSVVSLLLWDGV